MCVNIDGGRCMSMLRHMASTALRLRKTAELTQAATSDLVAALKAVADPARLQIIDILKSRPNLEACVCEFTKPLQLSQPTVSHHLKVLAKAGVVERERRGTWAWFRLNQERLDQLANYFQA